MPATPLRPNSATPGDNQPATPVSHDEQWLVFWKKNGRVLIAACWLAVLAIGAKYGWDYFTGQREAALEQSFSDAATPAALKAFADAHPGELLAGLAELRVADEDYAAGRGEEATSEYTKAVVALKSDPLESRAQLGLAMAQIETGNSPEGQAGLKHIADDDAQTKDVRAEAAYQLASLAAAEGRGSDLQKLATQILQIDPQSFWAQSAVALMEQAAPATSAARLFPAAGAR